MGLDLGNRLFPVTEICVHVLDRASAILPEWSKGEDLRSSVFIHSWVRTPQIVFNVYHALVAQWIPRRTSNPKNGGSNPPGGT